MARPSRRAVLGRPAAVHQPAGHAGRVSGRIAGQRLGVGLPAQLDEADLGHRDRLRVQAAGDRRSAGRRPGRRRRPATRTAPARPARRARAPATRTAGAAVGAGDHGEQPGQPGAGVRRGPAEVGRVGEVGGGEHVQPGQDLTGRPRPGLHHRRRGRPRPAARPARPGRRRRRPAARPAGRPRPPARPRRGPRAARTRCSPRPTPGAAPCARAAGRWRVRAASAASRDAGQVEQRGQRVGPAGRAAGRAGRRSAGTEGDRHGCDGTSRRGPPDHRHAPCRARR